MLDESPLVEPPLLDLARGWPSTTSRRPASATGSCCRPRACGRAAPSCASSTPAEAGEATRIPCCGAARAARCALSTLEQRLGRDPQARVARLRRAGLVEVEQDLEAPGFREVRVAVLAEAALEPRGRAQAEVLERLRAAGGRARVADLVRDRPSLRGRGRPARREGSAAPRRASATCARPRGCPRATCAAGGADRRTRRRRSRPLLEAARRRRLPAVPPPRRHGQRQDRGLLPRRRGGPRAGPRRDRPRARDRPHPDARARGARRASGARCRCCTASSRRGSGTTSGGASGRARRGSSSARARRCSRRCPTSASSSSTRSTRGPTSRTRARATTAATSR